MKARRSLARQSVARQDTNVPSSSFLTGQAAQLREELHQEVRTMFREHSEELFREMRLRSGSPAPIISSAPVPARRLQPQRAVKNVKCSKCGKPLHICKGECTSPVPPQRAEALRVQVRPSMGSNLNQDAPEFQGGNHWDEFDQRSGGPVQGSRNITPQYEEFEEEEEEPMGEEDLEDEDEEITQSQGVRVAPWENPFMKLGIIQDPTVWEYHVQQGAQMAILRESLLKRYVPRAIES